MANIISCIVSNAKPGEKRADPNKNFLYFVKIDGDPTAGDGVDLPVGSVCAWDDSSIIKLYSKNSLSPTDWTLIFTPQSKARHDNLYFIGSGVGSSKTTTVRDGSVIAEQMGVGDELFVMWHFHTQLDKTQPVNIEVEWYLNATETNKLISGDIEITFVNGTNINIVTDTLNLVDEPVPSPSYTSKRSLFPLNLMDYPEAEEAESLHIIFRRVASSDDPTASPRLHHISVKYSLL